MAATFSINIEFQAIILYIDCIKIDISFNDQTINDTSIEEEIICWGFCSKKEQITTEPSCENKVGCIMHAKQSKCWTRTWVNPCNISMF